MFNAIRTMIVVFCTALTDLFEAVGKGSKSLNALADRGLQESEMVRDRGKIKNAKELAEIDKQLKRIGTTRKSPARKTSAKKKT